ncbi:anillin [Tetranychus urticae]|uniref:anillin n=1 Tax=Tetranychus urticae TaxID=32264 RepID=UPI000D650EDC|nr:anillin [Tetranychus urticae]
MSDIKQNDYITANSSNSIPTNKIDSTDPCLLPLAARRALFEKKATRPVVDITRNNDIEEALAAFKEIEELPSEDDLSDLNIYKEKDILSEDKNVEHVETYSNDSISLNEADISSTDEENCNQDYKNNLNYSSETDEKNSSFSDKNFDLQERNCPQESDPNDSIGSNASSLLSSVDENNTVISQSTKIYPELPRFDDFVYKTCSKKTDEPSKSIISPIKSFNQPTVHHHHPSPKKNVQNDPVKPKSSQTTTPLRTLSMYRREQKIQKTLKRSADDEDELITDLETEALKLDLVEKYREEKLKKIDDLAVEADKYNKIIYQSFRALDLCVQTKNISERIEAEKILLINMVRKNACVDELYRLKKEENFDITEDPVGKVTFNKLMLLVKGNFFVSQASGLDLCEYHFICLFTCGEKVIATDALSSTHAIQEASLNFTNKAEFDHLRKDFRIRLTVYALALPKGKRNQDKKNIRLTPKNKSKVKYTHSPALKASPKSEKIKCNFKKMGYVDFTRDNIMKSRFSLEEFMYESPLEDQIMVDLVIGGEYNFKFSSYLNFHETSGDYPVWNRRWCVLNGPSIYFWRFSEDEGDKQPLGVINLKHCVNLKISKATADVSMRPNAFSFVTLEKQNNSLTPMEHLMAADIRKERDGWLENLNKVLEMIRLWEPDCLQPMDQVSLDSCLEINSYVYCTYFSF